MSAVLFSCTASEKHSGNNSSFSGTKWNLRSFNNRKVFTPEGMKFPYMIFSKTGNMINGNGGCNNFSGAFEKKGSDLKFGNILMTEMFCEGVMETEKRFMEVLQETDSVKIKGNQLYLYGKGKLLARFEDTGTE